MTENGLKTMAATAADFGVSAVTVSDLVIKRGIKPKPMTNGKAKGLDAHDRRIIAKALGLSPRNRLAASA